MPGWPPRLGAPAAVTRDRPSVVCVMAGRPGAAGLSGTAGKPLAPRRRMPSGCSSAAKCPPCQLVPVPQSRNSAPPSGVTGGRSPWENGGPGRDVNGSRCACRSSPSTAGPRTPRSGQPVQHDVVQHLVPGEDVAGSPSQSLHAQNFSTIQAHSPAGVDSHSRRSAGGSTGLSRSPSPTRDGNPGGRSRLFPLGELTGSPGSGNATTMFRWMPSSWAGCWTAERGRHHAIPSRRPGRRSAGSRAGPSADPRRLRSARAPPGTGRLVAEPESGQRRAHHVERVAALPPNAAGSVSGSITLWNSTTEPGQPCVITSGMATHAANERGRSECRGRRSSFRNCGKRLSRSCAVGQSYSTANTGTAHGHTRAGSLATSRPPSQPLASESGATDREDLRYRLPGFRSGTGLALTGLRSSPAMCTCRPSALRGLGGALDRWGGSARSLYAPVDYPTPRSRKPEIPARLLPTHAPGRAPPIRFPSSARIEAQ